MRKLIIAATTIAAVAVPAVATTSAMASVTPVPQTQSLSATTVYQGVTYVHNYTLTMKGVTFTGTANADSVTPGETVKGTLIGSFIDIHGQYPNGYTWSYTGLLTGLGVQQDSLGLKWHISFTTAHAKYENSWHGRFDAGHFRIGD